MNVHNFSNFALKKSCRLFKENFLLLIFVSHFGDSFLGFFDSLFSFTARQGGNSRHWLLLKKWRPFHCRVVFLLKLKCKLCSFCCFYLKSISLQVEGLIFLYKLNNFLILLTVSLTTQCIYCFFILIELFFRLVQSIKQNPILLLQLKHWIISPLYICESIRRLIVRAVRVVISGVWITLLGNLQSLIKVIEVPIHILHFINI